MLTEAQALLTTTLLHRMIHIKLSQCAELTPAQEPDW